MAKSVLDPFMDGRILVEVGTSSPLSPSEKHEVSYAALKLLLRMPEMPSTWAIKQIIQGYNPELASKLLYGGCC